MEKVGIILLFLMIPGSKTVSHDPFNNNSTTLLIDNGSEKQIEYHNSTWYPDGDLINSGLNAHININPKPAGIYVPNYMNTLRYFPNGVKNCYTITLDYNYKHRFRAGFQYHNYDGKSKPPTFDILLDDQPWATVNTSTCIDRPIYHEVIYQPRTENISVCLARTLNGENPFISSLEIYRLLPSAYEPMYGLLKNDTALRLISRWNFGSHHDNDTGPSNLEYPCTTFANRRPAKTVFSSNNVSSLTVFPIGFQSADSLYSYLAFHFVEHNQSHFPSNNTKRLEIYIDGVVRSGTIHKVKIGEKEGVVVTLYPVLVRGTTNVTISVNKEVEEMGPIDLILAFMEVYDAVVWLQEHYNTTSSGGYQLTCSLLAILCLHLVPVLIFFAY